MEPLETMPMWAQDLVINTALGFLEEDDACWEWREEGRVIIIQIDNFYYTVVKGANYVY